MLRSVIFIICSAFFLISCGTKNGPEIESGKVTETVSVEGSKGSRVHAEVILFFAGSPDDQKTLALWTQVRPVVLRAISEHPQAWGDLTPKTGGLFGGDPLAGMNSMGICEQIKKLMGNDLAGNAITHCVVSKFEKRPE